MASIELPDHTREQEDEDDACSEASRDSEDDGNLDEIFDTNDLAGIERSKVEHLGLMTSYAPGWSRQHGFREIYQNWRDGILRSFELPSEQFAPEKTERGREILIQVFDQKSPTGSRNLLGYIRFKWDKNEEGTLEVTNFKASLQLWHLSIGGTSKALDALQAGQHGEGFKMAALTFRRFPHNHTFRIDSSGFRWNFNFNTQRKLICRLSRLLDADQIIKARRTVRGQPRTTKHRKWEDVSVVIGAPTKGRGSNAVVNKGQKIPLTEFREWLKVTIDIEGPESVIRTTCGDLIMDPAHRNKLYLRGLLLPHGSATGRLLRYGYNFRQGQIGRDRVSLGGSKQESRQVTAIWAAALRKAGPGSELISTYTELMLKWLNKAADVTLDDKTQCLDKDIAQMVWNKMRQINQDESRRPPFYYCPSDTKDDSRIIRSNLKRNPVLVEDDLWNILRKFAFCRTPLEEQQHRFAGAKSVNIPHTKFASHVNWMLRCCFASEQLTRSMKFGFVEGSDLGIDVALIDSVWKIHHRWLTFDGANYDTYCEEAAPTETGNEVFNCDHAILQLWGLVLSQIVATDGNHAIAKNKSRLKSLASVRLSQMPRNIVCAPTSRRGELLVTWESIEPRKNNSKPVKVTLHSPSCMGELPRSWDDPAHCRLILNYQEQNCSCPTQTSHVGSTAGVTFTELNPHMKYYPKVSRDFDGAFFGVEPPATQPATESLYVENLEDQIMNDLNDQITISSAGDDSDSLYRNPTPRGSSSSRPIAASPPPRNHISGTDEIEDIDEEDSVLGRLSTANLNSITPRPMPPPGESYVVGGKIEHGELDWGGSFPGSHQFYRTRDYPDNDVLIAKPKLEVTNDNGKRAANNNPSGKTLKRAKPRVEIIQ